MARPLHASIATALTLGGLSFSQPAAAEAVDQQFGRVHQITIWRPTSTTESVGSRK
jgi:hypothetical protein